MSKKRKKNLPKNFPPDCLRLISLYMSFKDAIKLLLISKYFNEIMSDGIVWSLRTKKNPKFRKLCFMLAEEEIIPKASTLKKQTDYQIYRFLNKSLFYKDLKDILYITKEKRCYGFALFIKFKRGIDRNINNRQIISLYNIKFVDPSESLNFPQEFIGSTARIVIIDKPMIFLNARDVTYESKNINKFINLVLFVQNFINDCEKFGENKICNIIKGELVKEGYCFILNLKESSFFMFIYWGEKPKRTEHSEYPIFLQ